MRREPDFKTAICTEYENLLFACQEALENWRSLRDDVASQGFVSKRTSNDLLRLQAEYARAHFHLETHEESCELCRFVSKIGSRNYSSIPLAALEKKPVA